MLLAEVALALVLVTGAGLMLRTMSNLLASTPASRANRSSRRSSALPPRYDNPKRVVFMEQALERIKAVARRRERGVHHSLPLAGSSWNSIFLVEGQPVPERSQMASSACTPISSDYFETMGIRLIKGRPFGRADPPVRR